MNTSNIETRLNEMDQYLAAMNNRLEVIESIINEENARELTDTVKNIKRVISGDNDLGVPPLMEQVKAIMEFHDNIKAIIAGLVVFDVILLVSVFILAMIAL